MNARDAIAQKRFRRNPTDNHESLLLLLFFCQELTAFTALRGARY